MADFLTITERSARMARIPSRDTSPEIIIRRALHRLGLRFVLHRKDLPGRPDIVFPKYRAVVLVHGCFWHRHPGCKIASTPKSNAQYWLDKFDRNMQRDKEIQSKLISLNWRVFVAWECEIQSKISLDLLAKKLALEISDTAFPHP